MDKSLKRWVTINTSISADGLGVPTVSIYFSYCDKKDKTGNFCPKCQNLDLQKDGVGYYLTLDEIFEVIEKKYSFMWNVYGKCEVALIGGEPFAEINRAFAKAISEKYPTIIYTWRMLNDFKKENIDITTYNRIVCGEYVEGLQDEKYLLGSTNQIIINGQGNILIKYEGVVR